MGCEHSVSIMSLWERYQKYLVRSEALGFSIDVSRMRFGDDFLSGMETRAQRAFAEMLRKVLEI